MPLYAAGRALVRGTYQGHSCIKKVYHCAGFPRLTCSSSLPQSSSRYSRPRQENGIRTMFTLLPEIIDLVINEFRDDPATLESCALVSQRFRKQSQSLLFFSV